MISYDGTLFFGSQIQPEQRSVIGDFKKALGFLNIDSKIDVSGRTDRGVHATYQVINFKLPAFWSDLEKLKNSLNRVLPDDIYVRKLNLVDESFNSRFSAKKRLYRYIVSTKEPNPFEKKYITFVDSINEQRIKEAIELFEGIHNFKYFKKEGSDNKSDVREIFKTRFYNFRGYYIFYFEANSFLRSQIRLMVGFLLNISNKKLSKEDLRNALELKVRYNIKLAPEQGLYLAKVKYG